MPPHPHICVSPLGTTCAIRDSHPRVHTYTHIQVCVSVLYTQTFTCTYTAAFMCTQVHIHRYTLCTHVHTHPLRDTNVCPKTHKCIHAHTHAVTHSHIYQHSYTLIHTLTSTRKDSRLTCPNAHKCSLVKRVSSVTRVVTYICVFPQQE